MRRPNNRGCGPPVNRARVVVLPHPGQTFSMGYCRLAQADYGDKEFLEHQNLTVLCTAPNNRVWKNYSVAVAIPCPLDFKPSCPCRFIFLRPWILTYTREPPSRPRDLGNRSGSILLEALVAEPHAVSAQSRLSRAILAGNTLA